MRLEGVLEGLILIDGERLDPMVRQGLRRSRAPFVFLNVSGRRGNEVLGDYRAWPRRSCTGAAAVVAPLWSIDDVAAKELALRFYKRVFVDGATPASALANNARTPVPAAMAQRRGSRINSTSGSHCTGTGEHLMTAHHKARHCISV
jgi:hypothetical protein